MIESTSLTVYIRETDLFKGFKMPLVKCPGDNNDKATGIEYEEKVGEDDDYDATDDFGFRLLCVNNT